MIVIIITRRPSSKNVSLLIDYKWGTFHFVVFCTFVMVCIYYCSAFGGPGGVPRTCSTVDQLSWQLRNSQRHTTNADSVHSTDALVFWIDILFKHGQGEPRSEQISTALSSIYNSSSVCLCLCLCLCLWPQFLDNHWSDRIETCQVYYWGPEYVPFQCLILIWQVLPKLWPFIYQPMTGHVAA